MSPKPRKEGRKVYIFQDFMEEVFFFLCGVLLGVISSSPLPPGISWWEVVGIVLFPALCGIITHIERGELRELEHSLKGNRT
jgi:hypothetical protein